MNGKYHRWSLLFSPPYFEVLSLVHLIVSLNEIYIFIYFIYLFFKGTAKRDCLPTVFYTWNLPRPMSTAGLGTPFFSVRYVTFFSILKKERSVLFRSFLEFLATYETQKNAKNAKNAPFFCKEWKRMFHSFFYIL